MHSHFKIGIISDYDPMKGLVKVKFSEDDDGDGGDFVSAWIPFSVPFTLADKATMPLDVDQHVWCIMDERCEFGVVGGCIYNDHDTTDGAGQDIHRISFKDGSSIQFDRSSGTYSAVFKGDCEISCDGNVNVRTGKVTIDGDLEITGDITFTGDLNVSGNISSQGSIKTDSDVIAGPTHISLISHVHVGVQPGGGLSGTPQ